MKNKVNIIIILVSVISILGCTTTKSNETERLDSNTNQMIPKEYKLGGKGPGGGIIFYDDLIGFDFNYDGTISEDEKNILQYSYLTKSRFLEVAPRGWNLPDTRDDPVSQWGGDSSNIDEISDLDLNLLTPESDNIRDTVGNGRRNTEIIISYLKENTQEEGTAAHLCRNYNGGGLSDWFLPSVGELVLLHSMMNDVKGLEYDDYSSSSESMFNNLRWIVYFGEDKFGVDTRRKYREYRVRPIRAF
ncbi:hypothetical protein EW093_02170 [Thiospirochaeta perfilievii]|uniref:DUF1566 domain-containing protein n=1 Tax=Thiospirochaeta perfilievii TaxID=252967 RepID=A0A5C1Q658_9SPIO|nr:hypothetical protein [Thiospirochaeta perfilievii]QEN03553.1 hypothetical protein EW093_02170 [Thiospirochaeta perfilievii]